MRSKQTDALLTEISELRAEVERLTRERNEARVQLNMTKGEAENDYRELERDKIRRGIDGAIDYPAMVSALQGKRDEANRLLELAVHECTSSAPLRRQILAFRAALAAKEGE